MSPLPDVGKVEREAARDDEDGADTDVVAGPGVARRELLGGVTDAIYVKPNIKYSIADGFDVFGAVIYSQAMYAESTSGNERPLGLELNVGARYETEDGFMAGLAWGVLLPLEGLNTQATNDLRLDLEAAQAIRGLVGIKF